MFSTAFSPSIAPVASILQAHFDIAEAPLLLVILGVFAVGFVFLQIFVAKFEVYLQHRKHQRNRKTMKDIAKTKDIQAELERELEEDILKKGA